MSHDARSLRDAFDRGFADPPAPPRPPHVDYVLAVAAGTPIALRLAEISALHVDLRIAAVPTPRRELVGVATVRNVVVPVYDLAQLLGDRGPGTASIGLRWAVLVGAQDPIALAFETFERLHRTTDAPRAVLELGGPPRSIIDLVTLTSTLDGT